MIIFNWMLDNYIELIGAVTGIVYVFLEIRQTIWLWPLGIITSAFYILIFFTSKFYADMGLQVYYLFISFYGWYWWVKGTGREEESGERRAESGKKEEGRSAEHRAQGTGEEAKSEELMGTNPPLNPAGIDEVNGVGGCEGSREPAYTKAMADKKEGREQLNVTRLKLKTGLILALVFVALFAVMWYILKNFTDSPVPGWDSFLTALSIVATWMLARKILEHWILWIIVDIVSIFVYMSKGLYPTVLLFGVYSTMAFVGLFAWRKTLKLKS
jgi:nicotinamide mononucleotide transporter